MTLTEMRCLTHMCVFLSFCKKRKDCFWSGFQFIQLPGIMDFIFFPSGTCYMLLSRLSDSTMEPVIETNWVQLCVESCVTGLELWFAAQELQDLSFTASLDMPSC